MNGVDVAVEVVRLVTVPTEVCEEIFTAAIEGGVNYWCSFTDYQPYPPQSAALHPHNNEDQEFFADIKTVEIGLQRWANEFPERFLRFADDNFFDYDETDADTIFQLGLFGRVRYL